ncbi:hypothetical protein ABQF26_03690 [Mycolicibacterium elephantis]
MPEHLVIFDLPAWLEPGEDAADDVDARAAYERHLEARREWYAEHELPPLADAIATPDAPFDPCELLTFDGVRCGSWEALAAMQAARRDQLNGGRVGA